MRKLCTERWREWTRLALLFSDSLMHSIICHAQHHLVPQGHKLVFHVRPESVNEVDTLVGEVLKEVLLNVTLVGKHFAVEHLGEDPPHPGALLSTFAGVKQKVSTSPFSLHSRCSLKPWNRPIIPFPFLESSSNTLLNILLMSCHTGIIVLSTKLMLVHFPKPWMRMKTIRSKNTRDMSSTKRL